ncbi:Chromosome partition protein smc [hydrothermal vent metagenome]|uniref:Chromosome partition protein smc n=1 Tax=hydrothermal vent metagenome TaxID=652676 RepID=A0A3B1BSH8_9ZZZZ
MQLTKLKLSGFKSFVDPTTVPLPSQLIGVVGPNGCGKSNIIDAVRWVMGESSAKHLRGDSMADVIFNGSSSRKPVGQATVELVFDNTDAAVGGQYAQYNEIAIKRTVTRDGQSLYHLNGSRCRRRDITDIFLGTGLGPRSYSIIEQGTISRIIEAKPEEIRVFLEEAAGISKYKERRRETENRMRHTRENLERLSDLREELDKQLNRLQRQARTAERYKELREEERLMKAQLQALRWTALNEQAEVAENRIREQETEQESAIANQRNIEAEIEKQRSLHSESHDSFNEIQSRFYSVGADIARLEQTLQHAKERRQQQQQDLAQLEKDGQEAQGHQAADRKRIEEIQAQLTQLEPQLQQFEESESLSAQLLAEAEEAMQSWQSQWEAFNQQAAEPAQQAEVERTRIMHLEQKLSRLQQRLEKVQQELGQQSPQQLQEEVKQLQQQQAEIEARVQEQQALLSEKQQQIRALRESGHSLNSQLDQARGQLQNLRGRSASLEALQQAALGKEKGAVSEWLQGQQLQDAPRLAEELEVTAGWERAVECVLGSHLEAVCVSGVDPLVSVLDELKEGSLNLFDISANVTATEHGKATPLTDKVSAPWSLVPLLGDIYATETLADALSLRNQLGDSESIVTQDGIWLGANWLRVVRDTDEKAGVLRREHELKTLAADIEAQQQVVQNLQAKLEAEREKLQEVEFSRDSAQTEFNQTNRALADSRSELSARSARIEQLKSRQENLQQEMQEAREEAEADNMELQTARGRLQVALDRMTGLENQRAELIAQRDQRQETLHQLRSKAQEDRHAAQEIKIRAQTLQTELNSTEQALQRMQSQIAQLSSRREELQAALSESDAPLAEAAAELEQMLERRVGVESEMQEARAIVENIEHELRQLEDARTQAEQAVEAVRHVLEEIRIGMQEVKVRRQTLEEQISESGFELMQLQQDMPEEAVEAQWQDNVEALAQKISRLGPINLAAIEEFEQQSERKQYLDAQNDDLSEALATLEAAIHKIDKETRTRFKETFDKVNAGFKRLFPRLFGGGHAYLELTGDDLLDTGVTLMARPPGKRNSTIQLLSGGEKAMTAVALVFSIFELNPAPFCMLDEVDAPLDDANVSRYCDMLKEMSEQTQFIFITHNKVTMEVAQQLTGVTMHEPGVSRLVAVDVDEAVELVAV